MLKRKYKKILIVSICIVFLAMSITSGIMAGNIIHIENCDMDNCPLCNLILLSTDFMRDVRILYVYTMVFIVIIFLIQLMHRKTKNRIKLTLVELKVVQIK